ncbi:MAG: adenosine kinase [Desulfobacterales bacterium]
MAVAKEGHATYFPLPDPGRRTIVGVGSALVDILIRAGDEFVRRTGAPKGGMVYFDSDTIDGILAASGVEPVTVPGGAACNTMVGIGRLGGSSRFIGKRGKDAFGRFFEDGLKESGVDPVLVETEAPTGRVLSMISPDSQRTMLTCLGAAAELTPSDVSASVFEDAAVTLIEGYLVYNPELFVHALQQARGAGSLVALDLASFTVVEECMERFQQVVDDFVDILIANEDEARAFTGFADEGAALDALLRHADLAVLKLGPRGSRIAVDGRRIDIPVVGADGVIDTTGAGDLWASGFLFGLVNGWPLERCGRMASACGYEVCRVKGASIPEEGWGRIRRIMDPSTRHGIAAFDAVGPGARTERIETESKRWRKNGGLQTDLPGKEARSSAAR